MGFGSYIALFSRGCSNDSDFAHAQCCLVFSSISVQWSVHATAVPKIWWNGIWRHHRSLDSTIIGTGFNKETDQYYDQRKSHKIALLVDFSTSLGTTQRILAVFGL
jgi:hypothetical protein